MFSQITENYNVSQDLEFFTFEHFETIELLKKEEFSCFAEFCVPCSSVKESRVKDDRCPKYKFKTETGQTTPILKLNRNSILYTCIPDEPVHAEDEIEIWLDSCNEKIYLFKDSLHYGLVYGCELFIEGCEIQDDEADICFPKLFFGHCLNWNKENSNKYTSYLKHLFADYRHNSIWLTKTPSGDMVIEIWRIYPFNDNPICEQRYSFNVSSDDFMEWWNQLVAMDNLQ